MGTTVCQTKAVGRIATCICSLWVILFETNCCQTKWQWTTTSSNIFLKNCFRFGAFIHKVSNDQRLSFAVHGVPNLLSQLWPFLPKDGFGTVMWKQTASVWKPVDFSTRFLKAQIPARFFFYRTNITMSKIKFLVEDDAHKQCSRIIVVCFAN